MEYILTLSIVFGIMYSVRKFIKNRRKRLKTGLTNLSTGFLALIFFLLLGVFLILSIVSLYF